MPKLVGLNEKYKEKGLVIIFVAYEDKAKMEAYARQYNIDWPIAIEPTRTALKAYGVRGYPTSFVVAPDGKIVWKGHPASKELEDIIVKELPNVKKKKAGGASADLEEPAKLELKEGLSKKLEFAVLRAARGELASALRLAEKVLEDGGAKEEDKADAQYVKEEVEKRAEELFKTVDTLLEDKMPYEAKELLIKIRRAFDNSEYEDKAQEKLDVILEDEGAKASRR
jgi:hypothetical protein